MLRSLTFLALTTALVAVPYSGHAAPSGSRPDWSIPAPADDRAAAVQVRVAPERAGWTYGVGEPVTFLVSVVADQQPVEGVSVTYRVGPEMLDAASQTAVVPVGGLRITGGSLDQPGFIRCVVTATVAGRSYRGVATAGVAPERIQPTQTEPADFDAFWAAQKAQLAEIPIDARLTLQPDLSTSKVEVFHVSLQNVGTNRGSVSRIYGILCVPRGPGPFPAMLNVPGAGVRPYRGLIDLAERGFITLQIGIHGIPVNLPQELYDQLGASALNGYNVFNLDSRERYYYRRVYLGCIRANDYLVSHPAWDRRTLIVIGGSQGGQLSITTAALDPRVTALAANYPAYSDVTGYLHGRAGGWPHMMRPEGGAPSLHATPAKQATTAYYDAVNFARRLRVPGFYSWGYNDETCPPTSMYAAYNVIRAPKRLLLAIETGHNVTPEQTQAIQQWVLGQAGLK
jgi:cephalosporin-C deacetylase-like acetyl esterase